MATLLMLAWSTPVSEAALAEYHEWYDHAHVPQLRAALPGLITVRRFRLEPRGAEAPAAGRFLSIYEFDGTDADTVLAAMAQARAEGRIDRTETLDTVTHLPVVEWYRAL